MSDARVPGSGARFADHFSGQPAAYARARPTYPDALFGWLDSVAPQRDERLAWDCGTGSGQAAVALAERFHQVVATDASAAQLACAAPHPRVRYVASLAECAPLRAGSCVVVAVAQALHWFDLDRFYAEAVRVGAPGAMIAAWSYGRASVDAQVDRHIDDACFAELAGCWPPERRHVDARYATLPFPFEELHAPALEMQQEWTREQLLDYAGTWSATHAARRAGHADPVERLRRKLDGCWPAGEARLVRWPLAIRAGRL